MEVHSDTEEILIRIAESGTDFIYTVKEHDVVIRSAAVCLDVPDDAYYGGSQAMD